MARKIIEIAGFAHLFDEVETGLWVPSTALATAINGENETLNRMMTLPSYTGTNIAANGATQVKTGAGVLGKVTINKKGASSNILTLYDNTSAAGAVLGIIDTTDRVVTLTYDVAFTIGLHAVLGTGTAADLTISFI